MVNLTELSDQSRSLRFSPKQTVALLILITTGLTARLITAFIVGDTVLVQEWGDIIEHMLNGHGMSYFIDHSGKPLPSAFMPVMYVGICYVMVNIFGMALGVALIKILQCLLFVPCAWFIIDVTRKIFDQPSALLALGIITFYPLAIYIPGQISTAQLTLFWYAMVFWALTNYSIRRDWKWLLITGICFGVGAMVRAEMLGYAACFVVWVFFIGWRYSRQKPKAADSVSQVTVIKALKKPFLHMVILSLVVFLCVLPLSIRNTITFNQPTMLTTSSGLGLWVGMNQHATGFTRGHTSPPRTDPNTTWPDDPEMVAELRALPKDYMYEIRQDEVHMKYAIRDMKNDPWRLPVWMMTKVGFYWVYHWTDRVAYPGLHHPAYWGPWILMLPFVIIGWGLLLYRGGDAGIITLWLLIQTLLVAVFIAMPRYRVFVLPFIIPLASYAILWIYVKCKTRLWSQKISFSTSESN